jgi:hypothetical protein
MQMMYHFSLRREGMSGKFISKLGGKVSAKAWLKKCLTVLNVILWELTGLQLPDPPRAGILCLGFLYS